MAQTIYVDSTSTAIGDNGTEANPYLDFESVVGSDLDSGGGNVVHIAGDHYLTKKFFGIKQGSISNYNTFKQWEGKPQGRLLTGVNLNLDANYQWNASSQAGVFYATGLAGADPSITVEAATVDGYYRGISVTGNNKKLEQLGATAPDGDAPTVDALDDGEFGYGDADGLGFDTFYVRPTSGDPTTQEIIISVVDNYVDLAFNNIEYKDLHFLYGNSAAVEVRAQVELHDCVIGLAEFSCVNGTSSSSNIVMRNCLMTQSHRGVSMLLAGTLDMANCVVHNNHLGVRIADGGANVTVRNTLVIGGESGAIQLANPLTTGSLTETNNCWYPRLNDSVNQLNYITGNWTVTDATDIPPNFNTDQVITDYTSELTDPLVVAYNSHNWETCDFRPQVGSPLLGAGVAITDLTEDFEGVTYEATPAIGLYQTSVVVDPNAPVYTVCSLTVSNSYQSTQFQASTICPLGRDWGTKRYTADGVIIPNYIHED